MLIWGMGVFDWSMICLIHCAMRWWLQCSGWYHLVRQFWNDRRMMIVGVVIIVIVCRVSNKFVGVRVGFDSWSNDSWIMEILCYYSRSDGCCVVSGIYSFITICFHFDTASRTTVGISVIQRWDVWRSERVYSSLEDVAAPPVACKCITRVSQVNTSWGVKYFRYNVLIWRRWGHRRCCYSVTPIIPLS